MSYDKRFKRFQEFTEDAGGAPANSAGAGGVAGIGQPPGSSFGEHPQQASALGGATTKTKKKNKRPVDEGIGDWVKGKVMSDRDAAAVVANAKAALAVYPAKLTPQLKKLLADVGSGHLNPAAVARLRQFLRDNGMVYEWDQAPDPIEGGEKVTEANATVAPAGSKFKIVDKQGRMIAGGFKTPADAQKVIDQWNKDMQHLGLSEERETFAGSPVFEVDTDSWMKSRFGKNRYHRYSKYVGENETGEEIRQHGRTKRKEDIILKDQATGAMTWFLRRKKAD